MASTSSTATSPSAVLLGALIGGGAAVIGTAITGTIAYRVERSRQAGAAQLASVTALREQIALAFTALFALQHALNWVIWFAKYAADDVNRKMVRAFDDEVHTAHPQILGALTLVASLNMTIYKEITPLVRQLYDVEHDVAVALHQLETDRETTIATLQHYLGKVLKIEEKLPLELARVMELAGQQGKPALPDAGWYP
jgi:hypothetical protein